MASQSGRPPAVPKRSWELETVTVEEAGQFLGCCRATVFKLLARGELKSFKVGRRRMLHLADIIDFIQKRCGGTC